MSGDKRIDRRSFIKKGLAVLPAAAPCFLRGQQPSPANRTARLTIETDGPARLEVRGPGQEMHQPENALMDRSAIKYSNYGEVTRIWATSLLQGRRR